MVQICYPQKEIFKTKETAWGLNNESVARNKYFQIFSEKYTNPKIVSSGLVISVKESIIAAIPDAIVECDCCGKRCVEIKCLFRMSSKDVTFQKFAVMNGSCLVSVSDNSYSIDKNDAYYY